VTWFKVDDGFPDHPKVVALLAGRNGEEAIALWTLAGAWSARQLTDGNIPAGRIEWFGVKNPQRSAENLVRVGLWIRTPEGFAFHEWSERQPSREKVLGERARKARNKGDSRARARSVNGAVTAPVTGDSAVTSPRKSPVTSAAGHRPVTTARSIPDPITLFERDRRAPDPSANGEKPEKAPDPAFVSELIAGIRDAWAGERIAPPRETRILTWRGWIDLAAWCEATAAVTGLTATGVAQRLVRSFLAAEAPRQRGFPIRFLAQNPAEYWRAA
jgi:hypothetical protein